MDSLFLYKTGELPSRSSAARPKHTPFQRRENPRSQTPASPRDAVPSMRHCTYTDRSREPTFRRDHVEAIERRLRQAEAKNKALSDELAKARRNENSTLGSREGVGVRSTPSSREDTVQSTASSVQANGTGDTIINEVSFLASTAAGDRHYLGSTSGVLFANLVRASVDISNGQRPSRAENENTRQPLSTLTISPGTQTTTESLPPLDLANKLVSSYLAHDHLCYPFLPPAELLDITDSIYRDPSFYSNNAYEAFVFDLVLAIATANVYKFDWQMLPSAETHHSRAMSRITEVFQCGGIKSLRVILLLCQYRTGSSMQDTSASMWHLVGIAVRICYELGLHRESTYTSKARGDENECHLAERRERETRRRCFWIVGITLGRPLAINLDDIDVALPSPQSDQIFATQFREQSNTHQASRTSIFVHITQYRHLCGRIMIYLHGLKRPEHTESRVSTLRDTLAVELDEWRADTDDLVLPDNKNKLDSSPDRTSFRSREWYEVLYSNARLLLFRPCPMLADISKDSTSLQNIFSSSKQAITIYAYLHKSRRINYSWITLHAVFMAGLSYIYAVSRHFRERRRGASSGACLPSDPTTIEIVNDTRACSNVLVAVSERWNALRHCHEVFDRLSDAVLADAIKLQCVPSFAQQSTSRIPTNAESRQRQELQYQPSMDSISTNLPTNYAGTIPANDGFYSGTSPLAVDSAFRSCYDDLQNLYDQSFIDDPVMQLSHDWLGYLDDFNGSYQWSNGT
ncbi:related to transcription activator protein acu-15 [Phialocephala subalpina]|uniref:Related to transcription activator protein acu-15 n=1 Tax=Phialocephala subalpina TaxID=576137 RepID=A0A1L7WJ48_9HELO|nr:related to transcription activator protein acu-15 [Phialocephala subalpina]